MNVRIPGPKPKHQERNEIEIYNMIDLNTLQLIIKTLDNDELHVLQWEIRSATEEGILTIVIEGESDYSNIQGSDTTPNRDDIYYLYDYSDDIWGYAINDLVKEMNHKGKFSLSYQEFGAGISHRMLNVNKQKVNSTRPDRFHARLIYNQVRED